MRNSVEGVFAAVVTPRLNSGLLEERSLSRNIEWLLECGVNGVVINGATGEYNRTTPTEFASLLKVARQAAGLNRFIAGIGAPDMQGTLELGAQAIAAGAAALLLPAPHFFAYAQDDVAEYCSLAADHLDTDILLYNLPQFTNGFSLDTVNRLLTNSPNITGIKDSSGSLEILRALSLPGAPPAMRIVGSDTVLIQAREEGLADCVISGIAGVLPELIVPLGLASAGAGASQLENAAALLQELLRRLDSCPVPWGLKWIAERRGIFHAELPYPLSNARLQHRKEFDLWIDEWLSRAAPVLRMEESLV